MLIIELGWWHLTLHFELRIALDFQQFIFHFLSVYDLKESLLIFYEIY